MSEKSISLDNNEAITRGIKEFKEGLLFTAVIGDVLDADGLTHQFLPPYIRPLRDDMRIAGRAMTVLEADCFSPTQVSEQRPHDFGLMFEALDDLKADEIYVCTGSSPSYALWGELMSTRANSLGATGAIVDGYSRDTDGILNLNFPTFSRGPYAQDQRVRGRVIDYRCPIEFSGGVRLDSGDLIFGDIDGVVVVPISCAASILRAAAEKMQGENLVRDAIVKGMSAREAWDKYGIM